MKRTTETQYKIAAPVTITFSQLQNKNLDLSNEIEKAFGYSGLGLIIISEVPGFKNLRDEILGLSYEYANLPEEIKNKSVHKESYYSFGWSHGKEELRKDGKLDSEKGSYYNNPQYDIPTTDPELIKNSPEVSSPNIWPKDLLGFEPAFKNCGRKIVEIGMLLAYHCDKYVEAKFGDNYQKGLFEKLIKDSKTCKARALHYFPIKSDGARDIDSWCGWHNDHSALTGLCPAMYRDINTGEVITCPDPEAGLYAKSRDEEIVQVKIPSDCLAFQIGECAQVFTGGLLRATPHAVRALRFPESKIVARDTFAVFMQPNPDFVLNPPIGIKISDIAVGQFKEGMNFSTFGKVTLAKYYGAE